MATRTLFRNARLLDPASGFDHAGHLLVQDGRIAEIATVALGSRDSEVVDCAGACLAPGLVDMRVELREPGAEHQESMTSGGLAAVAGGVTTMVALPNTEPVIDDAALVEFVARRSRDVGLARIRTYAAATKGLRGRELTEMGLLAAAGALAFTDAGHAIADPVVMRRALSYARTFDLLVMQHPEEPTLGPSAWAASGLIGVETPLPRALGLSHNGPLPLLALLRALTQRPAEILRLPAGRLAVGAAADLVLFDLERPWRIDVDALRSKSKNSPYDGRPVQGRVLRTVIAGRSVFIHES